jgi:hypothetical protein
MSLIKENSHSQGGQASLEQTIRPHHPARLSSPSSTSELSNKANASRRFAPNQHPRRNSPIPNLNLGTPSRPWNLQAASIGRLGERSSVPPSATATAESLRVTTRRRKKSRAYNEGFARPTPEPEDDFRESLGLSEWQGEREKEEGQQERKKEAEEEFRRRQIEVKGIVRAKHEEIASKTAKHDSMLSRFAEGFDKRKAEGNGTELEDQDMKSKVRFLRLLKSRGFGEFELEPSPFVVLFGLGLFLLLLASGSIIYLSVSPPGAFAVMKVSPMSPWCRSTLRKVSSTQLTSSTAITPEHTTSVIRFPPQNADTRFTRPI